MVDLLCLLLVGLKDHRSYLSKDFVQALSLREQLAVGRWQDKQDLLAGVGVWPACHTTSSGSDGLL